MGEITSNERTERGRERWKQRDTACCVHGCGCVCVVVFLCEFCFTIGTCCWLGDLWRRDGCCRWCSDGRGFGFPILQANGRHNPPNFVGSRHTLFPGDSVMGTGFNSSNHMKRKGVVSRVLPSLLAFFCVLHLMHFTQEKKSQKSYGRSTSQLVI